MGTGRDIAGAEKDPRWRSAPRAWSKAGLVHYLRVAHRQWTYETAAEVMRAAGFEPVEPYPGLAKASWRCRCTRAAAEMLAAGARPKTPYPAVDKRWECECLTCWTVIYPQLMTVRAGGRPCKWCAGIEIKPEAARDYMINLGEVTPKVAYPGVDKPWLSECNRCGREVTPSLHAVKNQGSKGCIYCAGNAHIDPAYAETLLRRAGAEPLEAFPGRSRRWKARCLDPACRAVCYPILRSIQRNNSAACPECSEPGFSSLAPSYVYLVINEQLGAAKVGALCETPLPQVPDLRRCVREAGFCISL